jgi:hypothetical protein
MRSMCCLGEFRRRPGSLRRRGCGLRDRLPPRPIPPHASPPPCGPPRAL